MDNTYVDTVRLLLEVAPDVFQSRSFAMKGGTALNFFVQDMPRLSVLWNEFHNSDDVKAAVV